MDPGKINHGQVIALQVARDPGGKVRTGVWDYICVEGEDKKDDQGTAFNPATLSEMVDNFVRRGDHIPIDWNHQSNYAAQNGQPAPALGFYGALAVVWDGKVIKTGFARDIAEAPIDTAGMGNGLWGCRTEVTEIGDRLLPSYKYLSPTFTTNGTDRLNKPMGYTLLAVAATNTPWQPGTEINFEKSNCAQSAHKGATSMGVKLIKFAKWVKFDDDADDKTIKAAIMTKMGDEAVAAMGDEAYGYDDSAKNLEEMAKAYEDANMEDDANDPAPHVTMRKMAAKFRKMGKMNTMADPPFGGKETPEEEAAEAKKMEAAKTEDMLKREYTAMGVRLGITLPHGADSQQMKAAISAATVPAAQIPALVEAQVKRAMMERDSERLKDETKTKAAALVQAAVESGYPEANKAALLAFASEPQNFEAARGMVSPFLKGGAQSILFDRLTAGGAPTGVDPRRQELATNPNGKDRKIFQNQLATFVVDGEAFSKKAIEWADAKEGSIKMEIDNALSEYERGHSGMRLIVANRLLKARHPEMWAAAEENY